MNRDDLRRRLAERAAAPERAAEIDAAIWEAAGAERAVLVTDMTGFTRRTREAGILAFLESFARLVEHAEAVLPRRGVGFWKAHADNIVATFGSVADAHAAAREFLAWEHGGSRACAGIGHGRVLQLDDDVFGDEVNVAFKLGEDLAEGGEVLVSEGAWTAHPVDAVGPRDVEIGGVSVPVWSYSVPLA